MSGHMNIPLLAPDKASKLLDDVIYERVLDCIDLEALLTVEIDLWSALTECGDTEDDEAKEIAKSMVDRALARLPGEDRRYDLINPFGMECRDCDDERRGRAKRASTA
jgi:hypothetical protein